MPKYFAIMLNRKESHYAQIYAGIMCHGLLLTAIMNASLFVYAFVELKLHSYKQYLGGGLQPPGGEINCILPLVVFALV